MEADNFSEKQVERLLNEFGVKTEDELQEKLVAESSTIPCSICGREKEIPSLRFIDGDPYCTNCLEE